MSENGTRRRVRTSAKQFELILDFMERHPNLATSQLDSTYTVRDRKREWLEFANFLNSERLGLRKDPDKWRKALSRLEEKMAKATPADVPAVAAGTRRRASRTSVRQFEVLLDYIEKNPCMVSSRIPTSSTERERHWQVLTERLNSDLMSVPKEKDKWKKVSVPLLRIFLLKLGFGPSEEP
ncbi:hypothetical protein IscW_ISCW012600 [Ixodes scapularis]|uniref:Regulatory protein zeste n=1 Tax=Ixodes scapularis TaxID=6945 RepID=B7QAD4_IXOSC|nr:hypothetical protein IscW_ISCW012600 [Ixodes scapularis]|eukprot:XP_002400508.1 hypothetical protein IscW_ISCW012600 [Ixodes scapularis]